MFDTFDFNLLNDRDFKEDSVREELILPIIKQLGYNASGDHRILRSKTLVHPYVMIGSQARKISIIPDYVFLNNEKPFWILDAKSPSEDILKSMHVEQAYSYAIHPEIRAELYGLCNGKEFALYDIKKFDPILHFKLEDIEKHWELLFRILNPLNRANPEVVNYDLDYGVFMRKLGAVENMKFFAPSVATKMIMKVEDGLYTAISSFELERTYVISFDFNEDRYQELLNIITAEQSELLKNALRRQPYVLALDEEADDILFGVNSTMSSTIENNAEESYIPFIVDSFIPYSEFV